MNTQINYLYRDADNYKVWNSCIAEGEITAEDERMIRSKLVDGVYFIPQVVHLPVSKFVHETEADHPWFEWIGTEPTELAATVNLTIGDVAREFENSVWDWDTVNNAIEAGLTPHFLVVYETRARGVIIWTKDSSNIEIKADALCRSGDIKFEPSDMYGRKFENNGQADDREIGLYESFITG